MDICPWLNTGKNKLSACAKLSETQTFGTLPALIPTLGSFLEAGLEQMNMDRALFGGAVQKS